MFGRLHSFYLNPETTGGGSGDGTPPPATPAAAPAPEPAPRAPDLSKAADGLVAKHGDPTAALRVLVAENFGYRDQLRELKSKLPGDGAVVLKDDDAKAWESYKKLGKPAEITAAFAARDTATAEVADYRTDAVNRKAADLTFPGKSGVLATLAKGLVIEFVVTKDKFGKPAEQAVVKGEGDTVTPLDEYAAKNWSEFLPALKPGSAQATQGSPPPGRQTPPRPPIVPTEGVRRRNVL